MVEYIYYSPGASLPLGSLWLTSRDTARGYDSDDDQYLDAQLDLQRRVSDGEVLKERHGEEKAIW